MLKSLVIYGYNTLGMFMFNHSGKKHKSKMLTNYHFYMLAAIKFSINDFLDLSNSILMEEFNLLFTIFFKLSHYF
jgi:hypothetical protein